MVKEHGLNIRSDAKDGQNDYRFYGLPLFKAMAVKYGWNNPIGEDSGREKKYNSQY